MTYVLLQTHIVYGYIDRCVNIYVMVIVIVIVIIIYLSTYLSI